MFNLHAKPDLSGEMEMMGKGRLVKVRFADQTAPNVSWIWLQLGNCWACKYRQASPPECLNENITPTQFFDEYMVTNTCPEFEAGETNKGRVDILDVMKAIGLVPGKPSQKVVVIVDEPWSLPLAIRAHREESIFLNMAAQVDSGGDNDPSHGEYVDMEDDLENLVVTSTPDTDLEEEPDDNGDVQLALSPGEKYFVAPPKEKGWVKVRNGKFGGHIYRRTGDSTSSPVPTPSTAPASVLPDHVEKAFAVVKRVAGQSNLAPLVKVRAALTDEGITERAQQDAVINELRRSGRVSASGLEGRHGATAQEREAGIREGDNLLGYLAVRLSVDASGHEHKGKGPGGGQFGKGGGGGDAGTPGPSKAPATAPTTSELSGPTTRLGRMWAAIFHRNPVNSASGKDFQSPLHSSAVKEMLVGNSKHNLSAGGLGGSYQDTMLTEIMRETGRADPPKVVSTQEMDRLVNEKGWTPMYRAVDQAHQAEQFKTGDLYNGAGIYGNGTYTAKRRAWQAGEQGALGQVRAYGPNRMRMALPPNARIVTHEVLKKERSAYQTDLSKELQSGKINMDGYQKMMKVVDDLGRFAALRNYDMIDASGASGYGYCVVLNRSMMAVQQENIP